MGYILKYYRKEKKNILGLILFFILLNVIVFFVWELIRWMRIVSSVSPLSQLVVTGKRFYTTDDDIRQSVLSLGPIGTFMMQDISLIQKQIMRYPWIKQVSIRKQWPNKIKIFIIEYVPVVSWNRVYMMTKDLVLFKIPKQRVNKKLFPVLFGPSGSEQYVLDAYYIFNQTLQFCGLGVVSVTVNHRYSWEIVLQDGVKLILGRKNVVEKLQRFVQVYPAFLKKYEKKTSDCISYIDLRYASGFSVKSIDDSRKN